MPVEADSGKGGTVRANAARRERKGIPQGAPVSPLFSNIYMRRFLLGWEFLGFAERFGAVIVNYADDFVVLGRVPAERMLAVVTRLMNRLELPMNASKTRCLRCPDEPLGSLGAGLAGTAGETAAVAIPALGRARRARRACAARSARRLVRSRWAPLPKRWLANSTGCCRAGQATSYSDRFVQPMSLWTGMRSSGC